MIDPVTGFSYPEEWVRRAGEQGDITAVQEGRAVLTASGGILRRGITTGATAAAAAKAAVLSLRQPVSGVDLLLPCGIRVLVDAAGENGEGSLVKDPGDYPDDRTAGLLFKAAAAPSPEIVLHAGEGIGRFTRDTPRYLEGEPAISPPARDCILHAITEAVRDTGLAGAHVTLTVAGGEEAGADTLNPKIGVFGGISLLGTTGFVEPWDDHLESSMEERVRAADRVVITTGRIGLRISRLLFPEYEVVLAGSKIRQALQAADGVVILCGLPGLVLKYLRPDILDGTGYQTVEEYLAIPQGITTMKKVLGESVPQGVRVVIVNRDGEIMGDSG
ncbi:MAG: cobalt-precorrin-5B (C(1))-methyltransferase [Methanocalculus sp. MSAO_Arc1]|uniref:cobalt-precorrin-5B (C(1))-methyltransferase n=1 Tax=Methanocalculus TaxID=71151 RepID=UPI000FF0CDE4|nr:MULTISPECIES: cobalt-precorrin-5B (C(1))-methyltransferase [unclassified Methanocalculus]MCP1662401.1 cobalt-precorrin-5B (C1)-methyltransferase [Methanocalculus sp. AMF5]RQD81355.1 MAG: cobalt-precorrin-5B (C(1))-methyltransferase [Methanocalculus sp. MSAO_Arc1]